MTYDNMKTKITNGEQTETKGQHTPGPWKARFNCDYETYDVIAGNSTICDLSAWERSAANARLIAAAPAMLEALKECERIMSHTGSGEWTEAHKSAFTNAIIGARKAIAKATGGES